MMLQSLMQHPTLGASLLAGAHHRGAQWRQGSRDFGINVSRRQGLLSAAAGMLLFVLFYFLFLLLLFLWSFHGLACTWHAACLDLCNVHVPNADHNIFSLIRELEVEWPLTDFTTSGFWDPNGLLTEAPVFRCTLTM